MSIKSGHLFKGTIKKLESTEKKAYVKISSLESLDLPEGEDNEISDFVIEGLRDMNRSLHNDTVVVEIVKFDLHNWYFNNDKTNGNGNNNGN